MVEMQGNIFEDMHNVTVDSWRTLRILGEMVQAFDTLNSIRRKCISIFG